MIKNFKYYLLVISFSIFLSGCAVQRYPISTKNIKSNTKKSQLKQPSITVPPIPPLTSQEFIDYKNRQTDLSKVKIKQLTWIQILQHMTKKMLQVQCINNNSTLLVNSLNNCTNDLLNTNEFNEVLNNILSNNGKFILVSSKQLDTTKRKLSLSSQDSLNSRTKSIGIARIVGAKYILYPSAINNKNSVMLYMQLIFTQTGEIIWADQNIILCTDDHT